MSEYIIAKYIRLSVDDVITDSLSIPNQRRMLDKYIDLLDIPSTSILEFVDNGYTGTNFERPAVQELLALVQSGRIDCIVCKDCSRFGRNAAETEYFIEQIFPLYQTRFISVDDRFDSDDYKETTGGMDVAFKYIAHEQYSRDLSQKVKSSKRIKMMRGENIVKNAIYGYRKGDSGKWEPDGEAAEVVRRIYAMALDGLPPAQIRDRLFAKAIPTPKEYQSMKRGADIIPSCIWTARMVTHILTNEQYTGMYISGKQVSKAIGSHSKIHTDESEWIIIPDMNPPIICKEDFEAVRELLSRFKNSITIKPVGNLLLEDETRPRRDRMISGERLPSNTIYGYVKDESGHLIPDPATVNIIQEIFELAAQELSVREIREKLTIMAPQRRWTDKSIRSILQNVQYTGAYVSGKILKNYETGKKYHTAKSDWIVIPDKHPAIVSKELFDRVQDIRDRTKRKNIRPREYLLRGKVACGCCHYALSYDPISDPVFRCSHTQADSTSECHKMKVNVHELYEAVLAIIEKQIQVVLGCGISEVRKIDDREQKIAECEGRIKEYIEKRQQIYEQLVDQEIDRDTYLMLKDMCATRLDKLHQQLEALKAEEYADTTGQKVKSLAQKLKDKPASPRELVDTLIKKIYVSPSNRIEIEWLISDFTKLL